MGVTYQDGNFIFDFGSDGHDDIVSLTGKGYQVEAFGKCFYYGYEFAPDVSGTVRTEFIKYVKFSDDLKKSSDLTHFIQKAVNDLHSKINLYNYDFVIMPESSSLINNYTLRYIYRFAQPTAQYMELVKNLPENIEFDYSAYEQYVLDSVLENGRDRYTQPQKQAAIKSVREMMDLIHKKDYFTIAKDVKKSRFRPYIMRFLKFKNPQDEKLCATITNQNVLIVDDITTSGSTLNEILRTLRILNESNEITIFSLIGRKDLMAEK